MEKLPSEEKDLITLEDIRKFIVDSSGNVEVVEEGKNQLVIRKGKKVIRLSTEEE